MASISACSAGLALSFSATALLIAAKAEALSASDITALPLLVTLMFGPVAMASPQKHIAHAGSSVCAALNERIDSAWLKPKASTMPWSKYFCASALEVVISRWKSPMPSNSGAPAIAATSGASASGGVAASSATGATAVSASSGPCIHSLIWLQPVSAMALTAITIILCVIIRPLVTGPASQTV